MRRIWLELRMLEVEGGFVVLEQGVSVVSFRIGSLWRQTCKSVECLRILVEKCCCCCDWGHGLVLGS